MPPPSQQPCSKVQLSVSERVGGCVCEQQGQMRPVGGSLNLFILTSKAGTCHFHLLHTVSHIDAHIRWGVRHKLLNGDLWNGTSQLCESPASPACRVGHTSDFPTHHSLGRMGVRACWLAIHTQQLAHQRACELDARRLS